MLYIVSYDIPDDRKRNKVAKTLLDFGDRVQHSVFECLLNKKLFEELLEKLKKLMTEKEDSIRIYPLCQECSTKAVILGKGEPTKEDDVYIV